MTPSNLLSWSLQIAAVVAATAAGARLLGTAVPRLKLLLWHLVLILCLALPWTQTRRRPIVVVPAADAAATVTAATTRATESSGFHWERALWAVLAGGAALRFLWLGLGMWRLRRYRRKARLLEPEPAHIARLEWQLGVFPDLMLSSEVAGPVTFGLRRPVVMFPERFLDMDPGMQTAVACHELIHVRRRDWLCTVIEECVRAVFWFHPAIWWLLGELQLAREQTVDREVVTRTEARVEYVDALLAVAGARPQLDLAPAPLFLRRRHLKQRVVSIISEVSMSKRRVVTSIAASAVSLVVVCWLSAMAFPFQGAAQVLKDGEGVTVEPGARVLHRLPVEYPYAARAGKVQGTVAVELSLDRKGNVTDARVLDGPEELRRAVLASALQWHYANDTGQPVRVQAVVTFNLPAAAVSPEKAGQLQTEAAQGARRAVTVIPRQYRGPVKSIQISGLSDPARTELLSRLPLKEGDELTVETLNRLIAAARAFDEHIHVQASGTEQGYTLNLTVPPAQYNASIGISDSVPARNMKLAKMAKPVYPPEAKQAGIQGQVKLRASIDKEGKVVDVEVLSGDPLLVAAAVEAVRQWEYVPAMLDGKPVSVKADIDVNFKLQ